MLPGGTPGPPNELMRTLRNLILPVIALTGLFTGAILLGEAVPNGPIVSHLREAQPLLSQNYTPSPLTGGKVDVYTDCVAAGNGIASNPRQSLWERAMRSHVIGNCAFLATWLAGQPVGSVDYFRYWNGYTVLTRPALAAVGYATLRDATAGLAVLLLGALLVLLWRRLGGRTALCLLAALLFVGIDVAVATVIHSFSWSIAAAAGCWVLLAQPSRVWRPEPWLVIGALTTFLELLNNALVTLTLPLAAALLLGQRESTWSTRDTLRRMAMAAGGWTLGYFGLWIAKFLLAWATFGQEAVAVISGKALEKVTGGTTYGAPFPGLPTWLNLRQLVTPDWRLPLVVLLGVVLVWQVARSWRTLAPVRHLGLILVALLPMAWYEVFANHSIVHAWFTCRLLAPTVFFMLLAATQRSVGRASLPDPRFRR